MCGISGVWGKSQSKAVANMLETLKHRGPDDHQLVSVGTGTLGHCRLAIMDPQGGEQPYQPQPPTPALAANGEIYNWRDLRQGLEQRYNFASDSDSEVALHLFRDQSTKAVEQLDGMFALAYTDKDALHLLRDPLGIKPLYYSEGKDSITFASEMKALESLGQPIQTLPPGSRWSSKEGTSQYYDLPDLPAEDMDVDTAIQLIRQTVEDSVEKRLMSDVPLGAFLSGGLDSSIIAALAKRSMGELHTFSVGMPGSADLQAARRVAEHLGTIHHEYQLNMAEIHALMPEIIYHLESFDADLVMSAIPTFFTARLAAEHVKVILTGEGADELFAGYSYYEGYDEASLHKELRRSIMSMHNVNLQRVDRMTMAHSIEARVPFLDTSLLALSQRIPAALKWRRDAEGQSVEKWILRKSFEDLLPHDIVWRKKAQFDEGSGTSDSLKAWLEQEGNVSSLQNFMNKRPHLELASQQEAYYYQLFEGAFEYPELLLPNIGRWQAERF